MVVDFLFAFLVYCRLPEAICSLSKLVQLDVCFNGLWILPSNIHRLTSLRYLNLASNRLTDVPPAIFMVNFNVCSDLHCMTSDL